MEAPSISFTVAHARSLYPPGTRPVQPELPSDDEMLAEWASATSRAIERAVRNDAMDVRNRAVRSTFAVSVPKLPQFLCARATAILDDAGWTVEHGMGSAFRPHEIPDGDHFERTMLYMILRLNPKTTVAPTVLEEPLPPECKLSLECFPCNSDILVEQGADIPVMMWLKNGKLEGLQVTCADCASEQTAVMTDTEKATASRWRARLQLEDSWRKRDTRVPRSSAIVAAATGGASVGDGNKSDRHYDATPPVSH